MIVNFFNVIENNDKKMIESQTTMRRTKVSKKTMMKLDRKKD
jgi:hypothetical protein